MTEEEYKKLLDKHDWWYIYSDDERVYKRGDIERQKLLKSEFKHLYLEQLNKIYGNKH